MVHQTKISYIRLLALVTGAVLLPLFTLSSPVLANSIATSPSITELKMLPGRTSSVLLSLENRAYTSSSFHFSVEQPAELYEGYANPPDFSWLELSTEDIELAPWEEGWVVAYLTIPDEESLMDQKWQANISMTGNNLPLMSSSYTLLVWIIEPPSRSINWSMIAAMAVFAATSIIIWNLWQEQKRTVWATGLRTKHWLA